ncbi:hypothetical protein JRQ81_005812 [Phrynocephalus forsythii]|uniref:Toll-like receptor 13 n=1 Tax=Phrynocephalus forsythii TaxID=171643 RepID=A0A9Q0XHG4_9SAUR|nr:hypothetical protein JRQ81_005812 [Phrynocephalus forsythii]
MFSKLTNLRELHLGQNKIVTLHPGSLLSQIALQKLHLSYNNLSSLEEVATAVAGLLNLTYLDLSFNQISTPCMGRRWITFHVLKNISLSSNGISRLDLSNCSFPKLQQLNVTCNNISKVEAVSFQGMPALVELALDVNPLHISQLMNASFPNLTTLHLSSMNPSLSNVLPEACLVFQGLPSLTSLDIKHSKINVSQLRLLGSCTNLTWLDLSTTEYKYIKNGAFSMFQNLEFLSLDKCKVLKLSSSAWGEQMQLRTLILKRNGISQLEDDGFSKLKNLSYLDLSKNRLTNLLQKQFFGMAALRTLILQGCQITAVTRDTFHYARKMEFLDLRDNSMKLIKDRAFLLKHLKTLLLSGNKILTIKKRGFLSLSSLTYLSLAHNSLYKLSWKIFSFLKKLEVLDLSHNRLLTYNKYEYPSPFAGLSSLRKLDLSFQIPDLSISPSAKWFRGLENLQYLSLKGNTDILLFNLSLRNLTSLESLDLSEIQPPKTGSWKPHQSLFQGLNKLRQLWIEDSAIKDLPEMVFSDLGSLEELSLSENDLRNISKKVFVGLSSLKYLDVSGNPLTCSCENAWFQNWSVAEPTVQVALLNSYHCFGPGVTDRLFVDADMSFCFEDLGIYFFCSTTVVTLSLLVSTLVYAKFGWTLRHAYYLLRGWGYRQLRQNDQVYQYDAYISCCSQDYEWVVKNILQKLEQEGEPCFRLCFGPRDFAPGEYYINNVQNGVSQSHKTLCLVTKNYLENEWCSLEIQLACSKIYYHGQDPLVVVFMEEIPNYKLSPFHRLRKLVKQESYLTWPENPEAENVFWTKLREALSAGKQEQEIMPFNVVDPFLSSQNIAVVEMALHWALLCLIFSPLVPASEYALPKFICSPMPLDMDNGCQSASQQRHGGGVNSGGTGHWVGSLEEAKETILHLRETVVHQKEMILDQRETVRELTAKLSRCEAHSRRHGVEHHVDHHEENLSHSHGHHEGGHRNHHESGHRAHHEDGLRAHHENEHPTHHEDDHRGHHEAGHRDPHESIHARENEYHHFGQREHHELQVGHNPHDAFRKGAAAANTMEDPPKETSSGLHQMERMLESLKERLEHLQVSRLVHQSPLFEKIWTNPLPLHFSVLAAQSHLSDPLCPPGHKVEKHSEDFRVGFPLRTNYMYVKAKPTLRHEIFAFTVCLWLKSSSAPGMGTPFSYSVPGQANEVVLIEWGNNPMELLINDKAATLPLAINDAKWHHICVTWSTRDGIWESYQDGVRRGSGENLAPWHPVKPGGVFVLGQEQDTLGGRFDATQAFIGEISDFNMWGHILTPGEIYKMATCASDVGGDLINWAEASMELHGGVVKLPFNACH